MRWRKAIGMAGLAAALALGGATMLPAQSGLDTQRQRLQRANREADAARERSEKLDAAAKAERDAAARARAEKAAVTARIAAAESDIAAARARVAIVEKLFAAQRGRLAERQQPIARLIAALQSMARRPAVLSLAQPGSTRDAVHVRAVLGTVMPVVRERTAAIRAEIARARKLRKQATLAAASLRDSRARLEHERLALARLEARHRLKSRDLGRTALRESDRAIAMGEQARDIVDRMDVIDANTATRKQLASLPGPLPRPDRAGETADDGMVPDGGGPPPYRLPVSGQVETGLGELSRNGVRSRGLTLATWSGAAAIAPAAGTVLYAGTFESYGTIVVIDHGKGWRTLVTGLARSGLHRGEHVVQGARIGAAPETDDPRVTVELRRKGRPVDITGLLGS